MIKGILLLLCVLPLCGQVKFTSTPEQIAVDINGKPFTVFHVAGKDLHRPYLHPLRAASGKVVTRSFPAGQIPGESTDHPHQAGLFYGHGDVNGYNYWAIQNIPSPPQRGAERRGRVVLKKLVSAKGGEKSGVIDAVFEWLTPTGKPILTETRSMTFRADPQLRIIDFDFDFAAIEKVVFNDTKEGTFAVRLATVLEEPHTTVAGHPDARGTVVRTGKLTNAQGGEREANVWGKRSEWVDYCGLIDGEKVGVTLMDHPANPRHPTYWHSRAYGLHSINPFGVHDYLADTTKDGSMTIEAGQHARFVYRVVIHPGDAKEANLAAVYRQFAAMRSPVSD
jgi:hypothetical protein